MYLIFKTLRDLFSEKKRFFETVKVVLPLNNRNQRVDEPFDKFFGDIKKLIQSCEYAEQEDTILVDRIILGTNDLKVQEKLFNIQNIGNRDRNMQKF